MNERSSHILLIDDDTNHRRVLELQLQAEGHAVMAVDSGEIALQWVDAEETTPDLVITDVQMPGMNGLEVLEELKRRDPEVVVVVLTAYADVEKAVRALKAGAFDFLTKPVSQETLTSTVLRALNFRRLYFNIARQKEAILGRYSLESIVGASKGMQHVFDLVRRAAPRNSSVLIRGETGTGKELIARALHHNSAREDGPFVSLNTAAIPQDLLESAFFGHEKGAFTGASIRQVGCYEEAHEGTLFLDEIGLMESNLQGKLLRVLETGTVRRLGGSRDMKFDVRVLAATSAPLEEMIADGSFREDLYYRLNVIEIQLPPLRERQGDLPLLVDRLLRDLGAPHVRLSTTAMSRLESHPWPGNVRELRNVLERALILRGEEERITAEDLALRRPPLKEAVDLPTDGGRDVLETIHITNEGLEMEELERRLLVLALAQCQGNHSQAARFLGLGRHALRYRLKKHGLDGDDR